MDRPLRPGGDATLPGRPGGGNLPGIDDRPGGRPDFANRPDNRPNLRPDNRPDGRPDDRPNLRPDDRPNLRPDNRPDRRPDNRPNFNDRDFINNRPNFGNRNRWDHNQIISNRPRWANIDNSTNVNINNRWNNAIVNPNNRGWWNRPANRTGYWNGWGRGVRNNWRYYGYRGNWFNTGWWNNHYCPIGGWHYHYWNHNYPASYWWTVPVWGSLTSWFTWSAPQTVWSQPVYYDYGAGGNVTYQDNSVYIGGEQVATADQFAQSAMELATVPPPESEEQAAQAEWMPLGTFAVSTNEKDTQPSRVVQLAVDHEGIVSGTLFNIDTNQAQAVQGKVDKETQRVAFRIGENEDFVAETGLYNLTQEEAPLLVHYGTERVEDWLLVRLEEPASDTL